MQCGVHVCVGAYECGVHVCVVYIMCGVVCVCSVVCAVCVCCMCATHVDACVYLTEFAQQIHHCCQCT